MKYVVNHPQNFKGYAVKNSEGKVVTRVSKVLVPFFMGLIQVIVACTVELLVITHLSTLK